MKVEGLSGNGGLQDKHWYLFLTQEAVFRNIGKDNAKLEVKMTVDAGPQAGAPLVDDFLLGPKAISRLRTFLSRAGYSKELMDQDEIDVEKIPGLRVWAKVVNDQRYGMKTDGWEFRSPDDPPEGEAAIDYAARDKAEAGKAMAPADDL